MVKRRDEVLRQLNGYLQDPSNPWLTISDLSTEVLGYKQKTTIYKFFCADELRDIFAAAFEERKKRTIPQRALVYDAMLKKAIEGDNPEEIKTKSETLGLSSPP